MKLSYRVATISYCPDLTDPEAIAAPIAALLVGRRTDARWTAFAMGLELSALRLDPLAAALLNDLPSLVRRNLDAAMKSIKDPAATPETVLRVFHETLRTSVHVSRISSAREIEIVEPMKLSHEVFDVTASTRQGRGRCSCRQAHDA